MAIAKRKKRFFDVEIPLVGKQTQLQAYEVEELDNRFIKYDLTRVLKGKSILATFKIKIENEKPVAVPKKIMLMPYFLRRMVRKGTNYVEDSIITECKDSKIIIKPFLVTRRKVSRAIRNALRNKAKEEIINYVKERTGEELFDEILSNRMQKPLSLRLKKIYPLSLCEIRIFEIK